MMETKITDLHPEYVQRLPQWIRCRDAFDGGDAIKAGGERYLPRLPGQTDEQYNNYKMRAIWYDACRATLDLYTGMVFAKPVQYTGIDSSSPLVVDADMAGKPFSEILESALDDVIRYNRYGILVDFAGVLPPGIPQALAESSGARPYCVEYSCFDIYNWHLSRIGGRMMLDRVVLAEGEDRIRELTLDENGYHVTVWNKSPTEQAPDRQWIAEPPVTPIMANKPLPFIPFFFFDSEYGNAKCQVPPLLGLVDINLSHYRTMADLEHGRFFCGLPTPIFAGFNFQEGEKISLGSMSGIAGPADAKAYYLEFSGAGLAALEKAAAQKEAWMSHIGGGLLNPEPIGAEAAETVKIRRSGANATLASIASAVSMVGSKVLSLMSRWAGGDECSVQLNTEYLPTNVSPQEIDSMLRAVQSGDIRRIDFLRRLQVGGIIAMDADPELIDKELGPVEQGTLNPLGGGNG
jgi:hypothetical protein